MHIFAVVYRIAQQPGNRRMRVIAANATDASLQALSILSQLHRVVTVIDARRTRA